MAAQPSPSHIRLPQRADAVAGKEQRPGAAMPAAVAADPRTASQDPVLKAENIKIGKQDGHR